MLGLPSGRVKVSVGEVLEADHFLSFALRKDRELVKELLVAGFVVEAGDQMPLGLLRRHQVHEWLCLAHVEAELV